LIRNVKNVDPSDKTSPEVVQIETAMGAAVEVFEGSALIEVGRERFVPVKTTNDLLVLRSDVYDLGPGFVLDRTVDDVPFIDLDDHYYKVVSDFEKRFPDGIPSLRKATSFKVEGDWTFGRGIQVIGDVELEDAGAQRVAPDSVLSSGASPSA
jgi:UTP--glucose-1-phosphate uridylyltransferase